MTSSVAPSEAASAFTSLARLVYHGQTYGEVYTEICRLATVVVPGCDHACITTISAGEQPALEATTDAIAAQVDGLEWETGEGPCVDAILTQRFEWDPDITKRPAWPKLAARILDITPVRGMLGYRLVVNDHKVGALNMFSDTPGALTQEAADMGAILVSFASVALTAANQREEAASLRQGLQSNREIGKALGMLMATHDLSDDEAFRRLRLASNRMNTRLVEVAQRVVAEHRAGTSGTA
ncbi:GAF and ANTAR domain-containing protein [Nocardioides sp. BP30]|uniref:GAF and ANTAR domain-containing protein n=1 Tax=Nocardioides sp. BP30 TaxID=3036374 RepID=UPI002468822F|nr:GAF and ANTAR domain-containing protein [Nocardioides sp. BP30]WGL52365.1 GAF and ANTAR domain-containing protein [Nocardioides sp. BP30]